MTDTTAGLPAIERTLEFDAPQERVWRAITDPDELARWFPQRAEWELRPGGRGTFSWDEHGDVPIQVEVVEELRYLAWRWGLEVDSDPDARESSTLVEWWLTPRDGGGTTLRLRESGFRFAEHRRANDAGWTEELAELEDSLAGEG